MKVPVVLTIGTFDIPHIGHAFLLRQCEELGDVAVGVNSDEFVVAYKGIHPSFTFEERSQIIESMGYRVLRNDSAGRELILNVRPDIIAIGTDWLAKDYLAQIDVTAEDLSAWGTSLIYLPTMPFDADKLSSTTIRERLR